MICCVYILHKHKRELRYNLMYYFNRTGVHTMLNNFHEKANFIWQVADDILRQLELEQYGYTFLRINKFNLAPRHQGQSEVDVLNNLLTQSFIRN